MNIIDIIINEIKQGLKTGELHIKDKFISEYDIITCKTSDIVNVEVKYNNHYMVYNVIIKVNNESYIYSIDKSIDSNFKVMF